MKCKVKDCFVCAYSASGYCEKHLYMIKVNKIKRQMGWSVCNKKGCKNKTSQGKRYCFQHNWFV
jgi:hypothetical protein